MMIAFEFPNVQHPDLEIEWLDAGVHKTVWMRGCKSCQNCLSECDCGAKRVESKVRLYTRGVKPGDKGLTQNFFRFFRSMKQRDGRDLWTRIVKETVKETVKQPVIRDAWGFPLCHPDVD